MKKKILAALLIACFALLPLSACGGSSTKSSGKQPKYIWKMALNSTSGDNAYDMAEIFKKRIEKESGGEIEVDLYGGASLGSTTEILDGMKVGVADIMCESVGTLAPYTDLANIDAMPYIFSGYDHFNTVWNSDLGTEMKETIGKKSGFKLLGGGYRGPRIVTATKEMKTIEDFKGFKLRAPALDVYLKTWQWMKAAPTPMAMTDVYTALQQGTVNGQENPMADSLNYGFDEVCDYWIKTNHVYSCNLFIMDRTYYNNLPKKVKAWVKDAAEYAGKEEGKQQLKKDKAAEQRLRKEGKHIVTVDNAAFADYFQDFAKENFPQLEKWTEEIRAMDPERE
ncbi:MAG: TRAP transporter substrate-binding protein [Eubacteriales bacterium]|nr:TRAP transporter substrate-binding protein [Eubacteriales bacterium]